MRSRIPVASLSMLICLSLACGPRQNPYEQLVLPDRSVPDDVGKLIRIEGGTFRMGAPPGIRSKVPRNMEVWIKGATPAHKETVATFEIGKYEVTAKEYCEFLNAMLEIGEEIKLYIYIDYSATVIKRNARFQPLENYEYAPAMHIPYMGARRYCEWLSDKTGDRYRLPSEIEWEYTVRGRQGRTYPWGEDSPVGRAFLRAHYQAVDTPRLPGAWTVGTFPEGATPEGVHDLIGNANEWCGNYYHDYTDAGISEAGPTAFERYVLPPLPPKPWFEEGGTLDNMVYTGFLTVQRGGQYANYENVATGWMRFRSGGPQLVHRNGASFRVLREIDKRKTGETHN